MSSRSATLAGFIAGNNFGTALHLVPNLSVVARECSLCFRALFCCSRVVEGTRRWRFVRFVSAPTYDLPMCGRYATDDTVNAMITEFVGETGRSPEDWWLG